MVKRILTLITIIAFVAVNVLPAGAQAVLLLEPAQMISLSPSYKPCILRGIKLDPKNPFRFDFVVDQGDSGLKDSAFEEESKKLVKYFLASVTTPETDLWVNLSPYESGRIVNDDFGRTTMGRDLLAVDYILKQITSSLMYPDRALGKKFWGEVYHRMYEKFGTTDIPVDTLNKVWIVPEKAVVYENAGGSAKKFSAYIQQAKLKVMLETDYVAQEASSRGPNEAEALAPLGPGPFRGGSQDMAKEALREVIIPVLEQEVNEGRNFAELRQIYHSLLLAVWFKQKLRSAVVAPTPDGKVQGNVISLIFMDRKKTGGIETMDPRGEINGIYSRYVEAFKKGVYNLIREDVDTYSQETLPRKYFSGGMDYAQVGRFMEVRQGVPAGEADAGAQVVGVDIEPAEVSQDAPAISRRDAVRRMLLLAAGIGAGLGAPSEAVAGAEKDFIEGHHLEQFQNQADVIGAFNKKLIAKVDTARINAAGSFVFKVDPGKTKGYTHHFMNRFLVWLQGQTRGRPVMTCVISSAIRDQGKQKQIKNAYASKSGLSAHTSKPGIKMDAAIGALDFIGPDRMKLKKFLEEIRPAAKAAGFSIAFIWDESKIGAVHVSVTCVDPRLIKPDPAQDSSDAAMSLTAKAFVTTLAVSVVLLLPFYKYVLEDKKPMVDAGKPVISSQPAAIKPQIKPRSPPLNQLQAQQLWLAFRNIAKNVNQLEKNRSALTQQEVARRVGADFGPLMAELYPMMSNFQGNGFDFQEMLEAVLGLMFKESSLGLNVKEAQGEGSGLLQYDKPEYCLEDIKKISADPIWGEFVRSSPGLEAVFSDPDKNTLKNVKDWLFNPRIHMVIAAFRLDKTMGYLAGVLKTEMKETKKFPIYRIYTQQKLEKFLILGETFAAWNAGLKDVQEWEDPEKAQKFREAVALNIFLAHSCGVKSGEDYARLARLFKEPGDALHLSYTVWRIFGFYRVDWGKRILTPNFGAVTGNALKALRASVGFEEVGGRLPGFRGYFSLSYLEKESIRFDPKNAVKAGWPGPKKATPSGSRQKKPVDRGMSADFAQSSKARAVGLALRLFGAALALSIVPETSVAVTPDTGTAFAANNVLYGFSQVADPVIARKVMDAHLKYMIDRTVGLNKGVLFSGTLNPLARYLNGRYRPGMGFDEIAQLSGSLLKTWYEADDAKRLSAEKKRQLGEFEEVLTDWLMGLVLKNAVYDTLGVQNKDPRFGALYRTIVGNDLVKSGNRTYVCKSISQVVTLLAADLGIRPGVASYVYVFQSGQEKTVNQDGVSTHVAVFLSRSDGIRKVKDQGVTAENYEVLVFSPGKDGERGSGKNYMIREIPLGWYGYSAQNIRDDILGDALGNSAADNQKWFYKEFRQVGFEYNSLAGYFNSRKEKDLVGAFKAFSVVLVKYQSLQRWKDKEGVDDLWDTYLNEMEICRKAREAIWRSMSADEQKPFLKSDKAQSVDSAADGDEVMPSRRNAIKTAFLLALGAAIAPQVFASERALAGLRLSAGKDLVRSLKGGNLKDINGSLEKLLAAYDDEGIFDEDAATAALERVNRVVMAKGYVVQADYRGAVVVHFSAPVQGSALRDAEIIARADRKYGPFTGSFMVKSAEDAVWFVPGEGNKGRVGIIPLSNRIKDVFSDMLVEALSGRDEKAVAALEKDFMPLFAMYLFARGVLHVEKVSAGDIEKLLPFYYAINMANKRLKVPGPGYPGYLLTEEMRLMKVVEDKGDVVFVEPLDLTQPRTLMGLTSKLGQVFLDRTAIRVMALAKPEDEGGFSYINEMRGSLKSIVQKIREREGWSDEEFCRKVENVFERHELGHRHRMRRVARQVTRGQAVLEELNYDQFRDVSMKYFYVNDLDEMVARTGEMYWALKEGRTEDLWITLRMLSETLNYPLLPFVFSFLGGDPEASGTIDAMEKLLERRSSSDLEVLLQKVRKLFNHSKAVQWWIEKGPLARISSVAAKERSPEYVQLTGEIEARIKRLYTTLYKTWGVLRNVSVSESDYAQKAVVDSAAADEVGGIDLNPERLDMQFTGEGGAERVPYQFTPEQVKMLDEGVPGFVPVIVSVTPAGNVAEFLGFQIK